MIQNQSHINMKMFVYTVALAKAQSLRITIRAKPAALRARSRDRALVRVIYTWMFDLFDTCHVLDFENMAVIKTFD